MRNVVRARSFVGAISLLVAASVFGCGDGGSNSTGSGGAGGSGGNGGSAGGSSVCRADETRSCYSGPAGTENTGACKSGTNACVDGQWSTSCQGEVLPSGAADVCDGLDEDCNGQVDDGIADQTCGVGACSVTVAGCDNGVVPTCTPLDPASQDDASCNGIDDDCDGTIDEDCPCLDGQTQACYSGNPATQKVGECKDGIQTCVNNQWGPCEGEVLPGTEDCDGLDDDCNGMADDGLEPLTCGAGACYVTIAACVGGVTQTCTPGTPQMETCNGIDDDCNLVVDDGLAPITCGIGACQKTVQACLGGQPQTCVPGMPANEQCNAIDDDCDGMVDEQNAGGGAACVTGQSGICASGTLTCTNGMLLCQALNMPQAETCNGIDDNCNGVIDDGVPSGATCNTGVPGICASGTMQCQTGMMKCVQLSQPTMETCNGVDDDCDGMVDDGVPTGAACNTGLQGICSVGALQCINGAQTCVGTNMATTEVCNGLDDDCDGTVDDGVPTGAACMTGLPGICSAGTTACTNGMPLCNQTNQPGMETCNNLDDDCDGVVDDNPSGLGACTTNLPGVCSVGTQVCANGAISCQQNVQPSAEICDGKDNDCDGLIDETAPNITQVFGEVFANNLAGWTLGTEWAIGSTNANNTHDPAADHTPTADNGVAALVLGGNYSTTVHPAYYLTSPNINTNVPGFVTLDFWRWLTSDYPPYVVNTIEISMNGGTTWTTIWTQPNDFTFINDTAWNQYNYDVTAYKSTTMRIRFGFSVTSSGAIARGGWTLDDLVVRRCQ